MKFTTRLCLATFAASVAFPVMAQYPPPTTSSSSNTPPPEAKPRETAGQATSTTGRNFVISPAAMKPILALQTAVNANDTAAIPAKLAAAQKAAKTPDEKFMVASQQTRAALVANDVGAIRAGVEAMQASGVAESPDLVARYNNLSKRYKDSNQIDEALIMLDKAMALDSNDVGTLINLASIRNGQGKKAEAVALMQKSFAASRASGVKIDEGNLKFTAGLAYGLRMPVANDLARQWVAAYPSPANWRDSLYVFRDLNKPAPSQLIDLLRLARAANALTGESDYFALASALVTGGKLAEAKSLLAEAKTAPNVDTSKRAFTDLAARVAAAPARASVVASAKAALAGTNGKAMIDAGDALYGLGSFAEAAPLYRAALTKGADAGLANLHLGMALARSGDKPGATAALNAVTGVNAEIARYWLVWLATKA